MSESSGSLCPQIDSSVKNAGTEKWIGAGNGRYGARGHDKAVRNSTPSDTRLSRGKATRLRVENRHGEVNARMRRGGFRISKFALVAREAIEADQSKLSGGAGRNTKRARRAVSVINAELGQLVRCDPQRLRRWAEGGRSLFEPQRLGQMSGTATVRYQMPSDDLPV